MRTRSAAALTAGSLVFIQAPLAGADLVSHWKLDETSGETVFNEVSDIHGTNIGDVAVGRPGIVGTAYEWDGLARYVDANFNPVPETDDFSLFVWMHSEFPGSRVMVSNHHGQDDRWTLQYGGAPERDLLMFFHPTARTRSESAIADGEWHHVGVTRVADTITVWVDGVPETVDDSYAGVVLDQEFNLLFGARIINGVAGGLWAGLLDDIQVYDTALSTDQVKFLFNNPGAVAMDTAVPGDADGDGDVDAFDLGVWQTQFGMMGDGLEADFDVDGDVDAFDLGLWQTNFGTGTSSAVPEPATVGVIASCGLLGLAFRGRWP